MEDLQSIRMDIHLSGLLGFALKARQAFPGSEAVQRAAKRKKIAFILVDSALGKNSFKRVMNIARSYDIPILTIEQAENRKSLLNLTGYKIIGIQQGSIAQGFLKYLSQESK